MCLKVESHIHLEWLEGENIMGSFSFLGEILFKALKAGTHWTTFAKIFGAVCSPVSGGVNASWWKWSLVIYSVCGQQLNDAQCVQICSGFKSHSAFLPLVVRKLDI